MNFNEEQKEQEAEWRLHRKANSLGFELRVTRDGKRWFGELSADSYVELEKLVVRK